MPQMSPMSWLLICLFSMMIMSTLNSILSKKNNNSKKMMINSKNISWKW